MLYKFFERTRMELTVFHMHTYLKKKQKKMAFNNQIDLKRFREKETFSKLNDVVRVIVLLKRILCMVSVNKGPVYCKYCRAQLCAHTQFHQET